MASLIDFFKKSLTSSSAAIEQIFPLQLNLPDFARSDILATYNKILTDTLERTHGIPKDLEPLLWDSYVQSESADGLVTLLVDAMAAKADLFIVYLPSVKVLRQATTEEKSKILEDYKKMGESKNGVYISFKHYRKTDMLNIYTALEYCVIASLHKNVNLSKAVQFKMHELRSSVSLADSSIAVEQAKSIADALRNGQDVLLDSQDLIQTATPDIGPTEKAIGFLDSKRAFILGLPQAYVSGIQTSGIGSTGEADMRAVERGLKQYFVTIIEPVLNAIFDIEVEFKSQDFRQMTSALETLKTFDLVSDENLSQKSKREILARIFDIDLEDELKALEEEEKEREENAPEFEPRDDSEEDEDEEDPQPPINRGFS